MTQRRFGPVLGAGVALVERDGDRTIQPALLGSTLYAGKLLKGPVGELIETVSKGDMLKKVGGYIDGSQVPDAAFDFWNHGNGSGALYFIRLTDGTEVDSGEAFYSRHVGAGFYAAALEEPLYDGVKKKLVTLTAKNGGRWGGRSRLQTGTITVPGVALTATTLTTGVTMLKDEYKGASISLAGIPNKTYEVLSNTTAGVITVINGSTMSADLAAGSDPTNGKYELALESEVIEFPTQAAGTRRALSVLWKDGEENEDDYFGLEVYEDEQLVLEYPNLSLDPTNKWYAVNVINEDVSNHWVEIAVPYAGVISSLARPVNFYSVPNDWSSETVTIPIVSTKSVSSTNANVGWVDSFTLPSGALVKKQQLTITFTSATAFNVASVSAEGAKILNMGSGAIATPFVAVNKHSVGFTVHRGLSAYTSGDIITLDVNPLPVDADGVGLLTGGYVYYDAIDAKRSRVLIKENTSNTITLVSAPSPAPAESTAATDTITTGTLTFPLTVVVTALTLAHSTFGYVALTLDGGPHANIAALVTDINAKWQAATSSTGDIAVASGNAVLFSVDDSGADEAVGYDSFLKVLVANATLNLTAGQYVIGTPGDPLRVQARTELRGGYDGDELTDAQFLAEAADPSTSLLSELKGKGRGLVKLGLPGTTSTTVQRAWLNLAEAYAYQFRLEAPSNILDETAAVEWVNDTIGRNDFGVVTWPSSAIVRNPFGAGTVTRSITGMIHGREALVARNYSGYHKAAAGTDVTLPSVVRLLTADRVLNEEILNPVGIGVVKKIKGNFCVWGDRTIALDPLWKWKHQREMMSHYGRQLLEEFDYIIFALNDAATRASLKTTLLGFFSPEFSPKRALVGKNLQDACQIKVDEENNTPLSISQGDLNASISLRLVDTVERLVFTIGKAGIFETSGF